MARFEKGQSGNPGGRPKVPAELRDAVATYSLEAIETLGRIMRDGNAPTAARVRAAEILLKKSMPDLSNVDMSANIETNTCYELIDQLPTAEEWEAENAAAH